MKRVGKSKSVVLGGILIAGLLFAAIFAPLIAADPYHMDMTQRLLPPGPGHFLGTDQFGRDLWSRLVFGSRVSLQVGLVSVGIAGTVGTALGLLAGYTGGWVDALIMRVVDIFLAFPVILLAIALIAVLGPSPVNLMIAIGLVNWTMYARVVRANVLALKQQEFVEAARALGFRDRVIMVKHILPNTLAPIIVLATLGLGQAIVAESTLSFLGLGVQPPEPSWGWTLAFGMKFLRDAPHLSTMPGLAIMLTVLGFNLLGDGLRDLTDPRLSKRR
ncbi:MAG TPA: ABC transporter permease [Firmicutes bacterium]|nr:ABC transporter permease [Bacillota bacterium]